MSRNLSAALGDRALLFEPVPPSIRANPVRSGLHVEELVRLLRGIDRLDAIDIPELVDENHEGRPYYRTGDIRGFARTLSELAGRSVIVNKVVAHLPSVSELERWVAETVGQGLSNVVLVGGSSRYIPYPGPPVIEANRICHKLLADRGGLVGNIAIPQRMGEAHRMLAKTRAGSSFFTTQILFASTSVIRMLREYDREARAVATAPSAVLLSFAPIADEADAEFVRWLGADLPEEAEERIMNSGDDLPPSARSVRRALEVYREVDRARIDEGWSVPLGVNVEQVSQRHLASAVEMLRAFAGRIDG
jgi:5,10-methylenetetrahydrofolate reductase